MSQSSFKVKIQKMGTTLSNMVMPNIGAFYLLIVFRSVDLVCSFMDKLESFCLNNVFFLAFPSISAENVL